MFQNWRQTNKQTNITWIQKRKINQVSGVFHLGFEFCFMSEFSFMHSDESSLWSAVSLLLFPLSPVHVTSQVSSPRDYCQVLGSFETSPSNDLLIWSSISITHTKAETLKCACVRLSHDSKKEHQFPTNRSSFLPHVTTSRPVHFAVLWKAVTLLFNETSSHLVSFSFLCAAIMLAGHI